MKVSGWIVLLLAALLVAMPAAAGALGASNETLVSMLGTKINIQEEVGGILSAENVAALAVAPNEALALTLITMSMGFGAYAAANSSIPPLLQVDAWRRR